MKKITILPLLLLLCACGANSGSGSYNCVGSGRGCNSLVPQQPNTFVNAAANSNGNLTSMVSRNNAQVIAYIKNRLTGLNLEDNNEPDYLQIANLAFWLENASSEDINAQLTTNRDNIQRAIYVYNSHLNSCFDDGATVSVGDCFINWKTNAPTYFNSAVSSLENNGKILNIENASFTSSNANDGAVLQFGINEAGKIVNVSVVKNITDETVFDRYNDTNEFRHITNVDDGTFDSVLTYDSVGKSMGLKYSDFGKYDINSDVETDIRNNIKFAGGYTEKQIAPNEIATDITFSGKAIGTVTSYKNGADNPESIELANGRAYLNFDANSDNAHITSSFDNWYTVVVDHGATDTISFYNYHENDKGYDMEMLSAVGALEDPIVAQTATVSYYGPDQTNGIPTEAVGLIQFRDCGDGIACTGNYNTTPEIKLDMAFGVKKNP